MLFTGSVSDNLQIKKQYNPETNAGEEGPVLQKTTTMQKEKKTVGIPNSNRNYTINSLSNIFLCLFSCLSSKCQLLK